MNLRTVLYDYAIKHVGLPYRWGGDDPMAGFDCSGLVIELLQSVGVLPKWFDTTADGLRKHNQVKPISEPKFGALVFYGRKSKVTHVGFCLNDTVMIEAGGGGSKTTSEDAAIKQNAFVRIRPIKSRSDLICYGMPEYPFK